MDDIIKIAIAVPSYKPGNCFAAPLMNMCASHAGWEVHYREMTASLLAYNFNEAWCWALNLKAEGKADYFLMAHDDIKPREQNWFTVLRGEMEKAKAQVISVISPIKNWVGLTSTAFDNNLWTPTRLTMTQAMAAPPTWTASNLLFNTGLMLIDLRDPWVEKVWFQIHDEIYRDENGHWHHHTEPEDWNFSRQCHKLGVRCFVTRAVAIEHVGVSLYANDIQWGSAYDPVNKSTETVALEGAAGEQFNLVLGVKEEAHANGSDLLLNGRTADADSAGDNRALADER